MKKKYVLAVFVVFAFSMHSPLHAEENEDAHFSKKLSKQEIEVIYGGANLDKSYLKWQRYSHIWPAFSDFQYRSAKRRFVGGVLLTSIGISQLSVSIPFMIANSSTERQSEDDMSNELSALNGEMFFIFWVVVFAVSLPATIVGILLLHKYRPIMNGLKPYLSPAFSNNGENNLIGASCGVTLRF